MAFGDQYSGDPAGFRYPGLPPEYDWRGLAAEVQQQITELAQRRFEPAVRHELLRLLEERRRVPEASADGNEDGGVTQFSYLPANVGWDTLMVSDELLITRASADAAASYLSQLGLEERPTGCDQLDGAIVRLVPGQPAGPQQLANLASNLRLRGYSAGVASITPSAPVHKGTGGPKPGQHPHDQHMFRQESYERPVRVAIIDTGIWVELRDRVPGSDIDRLYEFPLNPRDSEHLYLDFDAGHGTFVTGLVGQLAPRAEVRVYKGVDSDGIGSEVTVACKILQAVEDGAQIINLSLGCQTQDDYPPVALEYAVRLAAERGVLIIAAAGNFGDTRPCWPAAFRGVVAVAGLAPDLTPAQWSSRGFWVTCSTVGQGLLSSFVPGTESPLITPAPVTFEEPDPWAVWSGTSFAAPQITGLVAQIYQARTDVTPRQVLAEILSRSSPLPQFGRALAILPGM